MKSSPIEHACLAPVSIVDALNPSGKSTITAYSLLVPTEVFPSCPSELSPQHATELFDNSEHPKFSPNANALDSPKLNSPVCAPSNCSQMPS